VWKETFREAGRLRLAGDLGYNKLLGTESGQQPAGLEYQTSRRGPLATLPCTIVGFFKTRPEFDRPDAQIQVVPFSVLPPEPASPMQMEREPGMMCFGYILRPDSEGSIHVTSVDPDAPLDIDANYLATNHDRTVAVDVFRAMRRLFATEPLTKRIEREQFPGRECRRTRRLSTPGGRSAVLPVICRTHHPVHVVAPSGAFAGSAGSWRHGVPPDPGTRRDLERRAHAIARPARRWPTCACTGSLRP